MSMVTMEQRLLGASTLEELKQHLVRGHSSSAELVHEALAAARDSAGEGSRTYTRLYEDTAPADARKADRRGYAGKAPALLGLPVSIKDSFNVANEITTAGSLVLRHAAPAVADSPVVARLEAAGAILMGRTNMSELGLSALGFNAHGGTPANPYERRNARIPGGSSSGAAVSVTDGMAAVAVCTDTGGSARVPAALCGLAGFKPSAARISREGLVPLSQTCDSVGIMGASVGCCAAIDAVLSGDAPRLAQDVFLKGTRFAVPTELLDDMDAAVARAFERALGVLSAAGATIDPRPVPGLRDLDYAGILGGLLAFEAHRWHAPLLARHAALYDPESLSVIRAGASLSALDYEALLRQRFLGARKLQEAFRYADYLVMPTAPIAAPPMGALMNDRNESRRVNALLLRNPSIVNFMDWCALSIPCQRRGEAPVGLGIAAKGGMDAVLLRMGQLIETCVGAENQRFR
jgi:aspartyl-tRNA(Asn)/glutamyl-tRNA(Gln) amidotransferase subunit A